MRTVVAALLAAIAVPVMAQTPPTCDCTKGCTLLTDVYPAGPNQPTSCNTYVNGTWAAWQFMTDTTAMTVFNNVGFCAPASPPYTIPQGGGKVCVSKIPPQPPGTLTITVSFDKPITPTPSLTFVNAAKPTPATGVTNQRVVP